MFIDADSDNLFDTGERQMTNASRVGTGYNNCPTVFDDGGSKL